MEEALQALADALNEHVPDVNTRRKIWADIVKEFDDVDQEAMIAISKTDEIIEEAYVELHGHAEDEDDEGYDPED